MTHLQERINENGWELLDHEIITGPHAGQIIRITVLTDSGNKKKFIYKEFATDRSNEVDIYYKLSTHIKNLFQIIRVWNFFPKAILMKDLGNPIKNGFDELTFENKRSLLTLILDKFSDLHTRPTLDLTTLDLPTHTITTEWRDWCCNQLERLCSLNLDWPRSCWSETVKLSYKLFERHEYEIQGPLVLTHGDPHLENIFEHDGSVSLIDWEWAALGSPLRDITILLQDIYEPLLIQFVKRQYHKLLLQKGLHIDGEIYRKDFNYLFIDHTAMMLAWEIEKYIQGYISEMKIKEIVEFKIAQIQNVTNEQDSLFG